MENDETPLKERVIEMLCEFMGASRDVFRIPYSISSLYNSFYNFYNINVRYDNIIFFLSLLRKYNLHTHASFVKHYHTNNWIGYDGGSIYRHGECLSFNLWIYDEKEGSTPIDEQSIINIYEAYLECMERFNISVHHFMWDRISIGLTKEHIQINDDIIKILPLHSSIHLNHSNGVCKINNSHTICFTQSGKAEFAQDFSSLEVLLSIFSPNTTISKVFKIFKYPNDTKCSYCVFLNDGTFTDLDFSNFINEKYKTPKAKSNRINEGIINTCEIEKLEKQIERLSIKLTKLKNTKN